MLAVAVFGLGFAAIRTSRKTPWLIIPRCGLVGVVTFWVVRRILTRPIDGPDRSDGRR